MLCFNRCSNAGRLVGAPKNAVGASIAHSSGVKMTEVSSIESAPSSEKPTDADRARAASKIIFDAVPWSAAAGIVPVPILDLAALAAVQTRMLMDLSELYGQPFGKEAARSMVSVLLGTLVPGMAAGGLVGSMMKTAPVIGSFIGAAAMATFGGAATYAAGKVFVRHFERGGTIHNLNMDTLKTDLKSEFDKAQTARP